MSKKVDISIAGNASDEIKLKNMQNDFLAVMGYKDATGLPNYSKNLSNFTYSTTYKNTSSIMQYSSTSVSKSGKTTNYRGEYNTDFKLADNGIYDHTDPTYSDGKVDNPPSLVHYNVLKYRVPIYKDSLFQEIF